ncbi:PAS domain S-box protein [Flavobacterium restrictum]|nr:PAS domain S-box protein [Flavobacterium restrictum]
MTNYINRKWKAGLNIGRQNSSPYLDSKRTALLNSIAINTTLLSFVLTATYYGLGFSRFFTPLLVLPISLSILWCNSHYKYKDAKNIAFYGFFIAVTFWSFYVRRSGSELIYIVLASSSVSICKKRSGGFFAMIACAIFYFIYVLYDNQVPFIPDPTINYFIINTISAYITAGVVFFQVILQVDISNHFSKSLDRKYEELNAAFEEQNRIKHQLKINNTELSVFNARLDFLVKESNEELYSYQTAINDNLYSIVTDLNGIILKINDTLLNAIGYTREELVGQELIKLKSDKLPSRAYYAMSKTIFSGKLWRGETKIRTKEGICFWVNSSILPIVNSENKVVKFLSIFSNINDQKEAEKKEKLAQINLAENEKRLRLLLENQLDMVVISDNLKTRKYVNKAFCTFFGKQKEELIGVDYKTLYSEQVIDSYLKILDSLSFENPKITSTDIIENINGEKRWIQWSEVALFDLDKNITEILSIGHDITPFKEMEFQNANYIAQFEELAFKNSHKFRGPLSNIIGVINLYDRENYTYEEIVEMATWIKISVKELDIASHELSSFIHLYHSENKKKQGNSFINTDFIRAKAMHLNWKYKLKNFLEGSSSLTHSQVVSAHLSDLGKWLYTEGKSKYGHLATMQQLEKENRKIHDIARELLELNALGEQVKKESVWQKLLKASDFIIILLDESEGAVVSSILLRA